MKYYITWNGELTATTSNEAEIPSRSFRLTELEYQLCRLVIKHGSVNVSNALDKMIAFVEEYRGRKNE